MSFGRKSFGRTRARELVEGIAKSHGYLGEDVLNRMSSDVRQKVEEAMLAKDKMLGASVITLAKNLYSSSARFVFELLQNADDNHYAKARGAEAIPFVSFHVYPDRIVLECNEDGFTHENLVAICKVGQSSKQGGQGYIGEKGIGFKSVFMVAWKVHIQSGDYSFSFKHKKGDSGMGMISPGWEDVNEDLPRPLTRITLFLHDGDNPDILVKQREITLKQFRELQDTILLFMKNIQKIDITMYDENSRVTATTTYSLDRESKDRVSISKTIFQSGHTEIQKRHYHLTKHMAQNLPRSENREYSAAEEASRSYARAEIVLAFPLTHDGVPIAERQEIFAFLPVKHVGLKFLIHTDFVTQANREDIVISSSRNIRLVDEIANAFVKAVSQFCAHSTLQYQWMRYLPRTRDYPWNPLWEGLIRKIKFHLLMIEVLRPWSHGSLQPIEKMRRLLDFHLDKNGNPLFRDGKPEKYLASEYLEKDLDLLHEYGLRALDTPDVISHVHSDLARLAFSRIRCETDEDWHSRAASLLSRPFQQKQREWMDLTRGLHLIPLINGQWVSVRDNTVFFSHIKGVSLPRDLDLCIAAPSATANAKRKCLFEFLGVQEPSAQVIRALVMTKYKAYPHSIDCSHSKAHLIFLYLTEYMANETPTPRYYSSLWILDHQSRLRQPTRDHVYIEGDGPYGARELFGPTSPGNRPGDGAPGIDASFLHPDYMKDVPKPPDGQTQSWASWLRKVLGTRNGVNLTSGLPNPSLSKECLYVARHRPEKFLGFLAAHWKIDGKRIRDTPALRDELLKVKVLCKGAYMHPLGETYLPILNFQKITWKFIEDESFPWLQLEEPLSNDERPREWETLMNGLGIGYPKSDLHFLLVVFNFILEGNYSAASIKRDRRICELYENIQRSLQADESLSCWQMIREIFLSRPSIFIPPSRPQPATWATLSNCLWKAPAEMKTKYPLRSLYEDYFKLRNDEQDLITKFFKSTLLVPDVNAEDFLEELKSLKKSKCTDFDYIDRIYKSMQDMLLQGGSSAAGSFRKAFEDDALVYVYQNGANKWVKISECLWSTATQIRGMIALNDHYDTLERFFVGLLGVRKLSLQMILDELKEQGIRTSSVEDVKRNIWVLNSFLKTEKNPPSPQPLLESRIFPIRYPGGDTKLRSSSTSFAVPDRKHLYDLFCEKSKLLDFPINDLVQLEPFLKWTCLESRSLSRSVKEIPRLCGDPDRLISDPSRQIGPRAHALLRIAVHFGSPRIQNDQQAFYDLLRNIEIRETDGISAELHLNQDGNDIKVELNRSELYIREHNSMLTIYVPRDRKAQDICFYQRVPRDFLEWIMTDPLTQISEKTSGRAEMAMMKAFQAPNDCISTILDRDGIVSVEISSTDSVTESIDSPVLTPTRAPTTPTNCSALEPDASGSHSSELQTLEPSASIIPLGQVNVVEASSQHLRARSAFPRPAVRPVNHQISDAPRTDDTAHISPISSSLNTSQAIDLQYHTLLDRTIAAGRQATLPSRGSFDMSALSESLAPNILSYNTIGESFRLRSYGQFERDKRIGAAGELFVFEALSHLDPVLPSFSRGNWQSSIREYVTIHPEYSDMAPWNGRETADITYDDREGVLTSLLIDKGHLAASIWATRRPKYFIEVKSTTGPCGIPFFMSKHQYQRMHSTSQGESGLENPDSIYLIARVFNLGQSTIQMRLYVDPEMMKVRRQLIFTAENWSVVPGASP